MNNRFKELAEQAGIYKLDIGDETAYWVLENFASLIVRECAEVANSGIAPTESHLIGNDILEHFGVEE